MLRGNCFSGIRAYENERACVVVLYRRINLSHTADVAGPLTGGIPLSRIYRILKLSRAAGGTNLAYPVII